MQGNDRFNMADQKVSSISEKIDICLQAAVVVVVANLQRADSAAEDWAFASYAISSKLF